MQKKVKFGIVGTGAIAVRHAEALISGKNIELETVFDKNQERSEAFAEKYNARSINDFTSFINDPSIDAITIATPTGIHMDIAVPAAQAGKHILCEKPLDINLERANAIIDACNENNVLLSAVFQARYCPDVQLAKKAVDSGKLGKIVFVSGQMPWFRSQEYYNSAGWRGTWALDGGGALMNQAIHLVDMMGYLGGDPAMVNAFTDIRDHVDLEVEDTAVAIIKYKNGAMGCLEATTCTAPGFSRRLEISGTKGSIVLEADKITRWEFCEETQEDKEIKNNSLSAKTGGSGAENPMSINAMGHRLQLEDLAEAILTGKELMLPGKEGRRAIAIICGIYESAQTGKPFIF